MRKRRSCTTSLSRRERVTASQPICSSRSLRCQAAAHQISTATTLPSSNTNWHKRSPASRPAPSRCSSLSMSWAISQSAGPCAVRISSTPGTTGSSRFAAAVFVLTRLPEHFDALLSSANLIPAGKSAAEDQAKCPACFECECTSCKSLCSRLDYVTAFE